MRSLEDSHEWLMWQAKEVEPMLDTPAPVSEKRKVDAPQRKTGRPKRKKSTWSFRLQIRLNAWIKGTEDPKLEDLLGYSRSELVGHLQRQFRKGMTWANYAGNQPFKKQRVWVVDHIVPKRLFRESEASNAFALTNLRPLWIAENLKKNLSRTHLI